MNAVFTLGESHVVGDVLGENPMRKQHSLRKNSVVRMKNPCTHSAHSFAALSMRNEETVSSFGPAE